jgi:hypothetical protein
VSAAVAIAGMSMYPALISSSANNSLNCALSAARVGVDARKKWILNMGLIDFFDAHIRRPRSIPPLPTPLAKIGSSVNEPHASLAEYAPIAVNDIFARFIIPR